MANATKIGYEVIERSRVVALDYPAVGAVNLRVVREMTLAKISDGSIFVETTGPNAGKAITFPEHTREISILVDGSNPALVTALQALLAQIDASVPVV